MTYTMHYGWLKVGRAELWIDPEFHYENGEPHYLIRCNIRSLPWFKVFKEIDMCFESLVNANTLSPYESFRDLRQGGSMDIRRDQFTFKDSIEVKAYVEDVDSHREHKFARTEARFLDALSTYLYLRSQDLPNLNQNLSVRAFFTNSLYEFQISPDGSAKFRLKGNKIRAKKFKLIFPPTDMIPKGKDGSVVVSNDRRRVPLKFKINLSLGSFMLQLEDISYD